MIRTSILVAHKKYPNLRERPVYLFEFFGENFMGESLSTESTIIQNPLGKILKKALVKKQKKSKVKNTGKS